MLFYVTCFFPHLLLPLFQSAVVTAGTYVVVDVAESLLRLVLFKTKSKEQLEGRNSFFAHFDLCICQVGAAEDQERRVVGRKKGPGGEDAGEDEDEQDRSRWRREHQREMAARAARLQARKE